MFDAVQQDLRVALRVLRKSPLFALTAAGSAIVGVMLGLLAGAFAARLLSSFLYGFGVQDPVTFVMVAAVFVSIAGLASYLPARAALRIDPLKALRVD